MIRTTAFSVSGVVAHTDGAAAAASAAIGAQAYASGNFVLYNTGTTDIYTYLRLHKQTYAWGTR